MAATVSAPAAARGPLPTTGGVRRSGALRRFVRVFFQRPVVLFGFVAIVALILCALFAPLLSPYDPYEQNLGQVLQDPSGEHWLGTDTLGRDTFSRIIF